MATFTYLVRDLDTANLLAHPFMLAGAKTVDTGIENDKGWVRAVMPRCGNTGDLPKVLRNELKRRGATLVAADYG
jgi:hypothetical protein